MPLNISKQPASDVLVDLDLVQFTAVDELPDPFSPRFPGHRAFAISNTEMSGRRLISARNPSAPNFHQRAERIVMFTSLPSLSGARRAASSTASLPGSPITSTSTSSRGCRVSKSACNLDRSSGKSGGGQIA